MRRLVWSPVLCLLCVLATVAPRRAEAQQMAFAQDALKRLSIEQLGDLVVTSVSKEPEAVWQTAAAIAVLTRDDLLRAGVTTVPDALRLLPGIDVARIDTSRNWVVGIRGFGDQFSKSVLVLVDGRSIYTPLWGGVHWPLLTVLIEDIDRIEVIRGPGGTIWGANAENGVINIITRSAAETHGTYASLTTGTVDRALGAVRVGGRAGAVDYRAWTMASRREPQAHADDRRFDTWRMGQGGGRLDWRSGRDEITARGDWYVGDLGESVRIHTFTPGGSFLDDRPVDVQGGSVLGRWRRTFTPERDVTVQGSWDRSYRLGSDFGEQRSTLDVDLVHRWRLGRRQQLVWGAGARTSPGRTVETASFSRFTPAERRLNLFTAFVQDSLSAFGERVTVTAGAKLERNSYSGLEVQPSLRALWRPTPRQTLWGGVTRAVRTPSRVDEDISVALFASATPPVYGVISGNRSLRTERVIGTEAGYRARLGESVYLDVAAFHNDYANLLDLAPGGSETRTTDGVSYRAVLFPWVDAVHGRTRGIEVSPDWRPSPRFGLRGAWSFVGIDLLADRPTLGLVATLEGSTPRPRLSVAAFTNPFGPLQLDATWRYVAARTAPAVPDYHALDLHASWPVSHRLEVGVIARNLLSPSHVEWARDPGPSVAIRRAAALTVTWRP